MEQLTVVTEYFKEVSRSLKFQIASTATFGTALYYLILLKEENLLKIFLIILFLFPTTMLIASLVEKAIFFFKDKKKKKLEQVFSKIGSIGEHQYTDKSTTLWKDSNFEGLGWQIYLNYGPKHAYLNTPCCYECKTDLLTKMNSKKNGFDLECNDCKKVFHVDDIGQARSIANSSLQGDVRKNQNKYFSLW